jgi:hypothetical protein
METRPAAARGARALAEHPLEHPAQRSFGSAGPAMWTLRARVLWR